MFFFEYYSWLSFCKKRLAGKTLSQVSAKFNCLWPHGCFEWFFGWWCNGMRRICRWEYCICSVYRFNSHFITSLKRNKGQKIKKTLTILISVHLVNTWSNSSQIEILKAKNNILLQHFKIALLTKRVISETVKINNLILFTWHSAT